MNPTGSLARRRVTLTAGELREHLKKMNIRAASDPKATDLPFIVIAAADDYSPLSVGL